MLKNKNDHTFRHAIRVCLFCFEIAKNEKLNNEQMLILLISALCHDIGRKNNSNDKEHGKKSIEILKECLLSNLDTISNLMVNHCLRDNKTYLLLSILKDADALDRQRNDDFDIKYLRLNSTKKLIHFAKKVIDVTSI
jgi:HD superfamily phosphodiesterase